MAYRFVFLGAPGSGKGTWSGIVSQRLALAHLSTGDLLRQEVAEKSELGQTAKSYMDAGELVPDELILTLVDKKLGELDGFILDGYPRNLAQAKSLEEILEKNGISLSKVIYLDVPEEELVRRITSRVVCPNCGATYNLQTMPPKVTGICDRCGSKLIQRKDDTEEVFRVRLEAYNKQTAPLLDYYEEKGLLHRYPNYGAQTEERTEDFLDLLTKE
ncbi:MAG: adenylate kinase [Eubacteriales bacterium]|nr:adenylate kinase [Eubacteriales bacterium]MDD4323272.1 adenylate kinase [Eubacteriales bacterium]MDD4540995.1 adenylate kinase [Eubacteriales bacterium]